MTSKGLSNTSKYNLPDVKQQYKTSAKVNSNVPESSPMRILTALDNLHSKIKQLESEKEEALSKYRDMSLANHLMGSTTFNTSHKPQLKYPVVDELNTKLLAAEEKLRRLDKGLEGMREDFNKYQYVFLPLDAGQEKVASNTSWISKERHRLSDLKIEIKEKIVSLQQELQEELNVQKLVEEKHNLLKKEEERLNELLEKQLEQQHLQRQRQLQKDLKTQQEALQQKIQRQRQNLSNNPFKRLTNNDQTTKNCTNTLYNDNSAYTNYIPTSTKNYKTTNNLNNDTTLGNNDKSYNPPRDPWVVIQQIRDSISGFPTASQPEDSSTFADSETNLKMMHFQLLQELKDLHRKYEDLESDRRKVLEELKKKEKQVKLIEKIMIMNSSQ